MPIFDRLIHQRNLLQGANYTDVHAAYSPYLFQISSMPKDRCQEEPFYYPDIHPLAFASVKEGIFLMDAGTILYLYLGRQYNPQECMQLFGK